MAQLSERARARRATRAILSGIVATAAGCALLADIEDVRYTANDPAEAGVDPDGSSGSGEDASPTVGDASDADADDDAGGFCQTVRGVRFCSEFRDGSAEAEGWKTTHFPPSSRIVVDTTNDPPSRPFAAQAVHDGKSGSPATLDWTAPAANFAGGFVLEAKVWLFGSGPFLTVRFGGDPSCTLTLEDSNVSVSGSSTGTFPFSPTIVSKSWIPIRLEAAFVSSTSTQITLRIGSETALIQAIACGGVVDLRSLRFGVVAPKDAGNVTIVGFDDVTVANRN